MDGDPAVEPELDSFSLTLPLPYRVAILVVLGTWAWGANLHYLSLYKIDVPTLIRYPLRLQRSESPHYLSTYRLAIALSLPTSASLLLFWALTHRSPTLVVSWSLLPLSLLSLLLLIIISPLRRLSQSGRFRFLTVLRRVSIGGIALPSEGKFGDILLADVLTSYAKVIADLFVALCMFFSPLRSATARPDRACGGQYLVPLIMAFPSAIRLRQCLIEYLRSPPRTGQNHLLNALKYFTAFPVIALSALQRNLSTNHAHIGLTEAQVYHVWLLAVAVNSFYSFYWDIARDWDLTLFSASSRTSKSHPWGLRSRLYFPTSHYYLAIVVDLLLRCTWSLKLSPHLDHFADFESGIFLLEFLEVGRRWMWIFFRVETEWVRNTASTPLGMPGPDDILLGDYGKEDED